LSAVTVAASRPHASRRVARRLAALLGDTQLFVATLFLGLLALAAVLGPFIWTKDPVAISLGEALHGPSLAHPMGTDDLGRDVLARFMGGARISLSVGLIAISAGGLIGGLIGVLSGALGGVVDLVLMRVMDSILAFPPLILAMAVTVGLGRGVQMAAVGIVLTSVPYYARLMRADVVRIRSAGFIESAGAMGASRKRIIVRHIVPNALISLPVLAAANFGYVVLTLAALSFVGLGAQIPSPEWGAMITLGQQYMLTGSWWIGVFPGLGLLTAVTAASVLADRIRDLLDPRHQLAGGRMRFFGGVR
jgi:peptide/nickel transport system permease protein